MAARARRQGAVPQRRRPAGAHLPRRLRRRPSDELETYELLDESTLLPPQTSEEWQRETAFAEFLRERDVACKFSSSRPRELTARALYDKYAGAETVRAFFELGGTAEALVKEICQERCTIENVDALWSEYCAQTLDEERGRGEASR